MRIKFAPTDSTEELQPYVSKIMEVVEDVLGIRTAWISDDSWLSDFGGAFFEEEEPTKRFEDITETAKEEGDPTGKWARAIDPELVVAFRERLGLEVDPSDPDMNVIVKLAYKLKQQSQPVTA